MSQVNLSLEIVYCSNLTSNYSLIRFIMQHGSRDLQSNCAMRFLFRLDLSLHVGAGKKFRILNYATKQGANRKCMSRLLKKIVHNFFSRNYLVLLRKEPVRSVSLPSRFFLK